MIRRRFILSGLVAAPAVVAAPGLAYGLPPHRPAIPIFRQEWIRDRDGKVAFRTDWWFKPDGRSFHRGDDPRFAMLLGLESPDLSLRLSPIWPGRMPPRGLGTDERFHRMVDDVWNCWDGTCGRTVPLRCPDDLSAQPHVWT